MDEKIRIRDEQPGSDFREVRNNFHGVNTYFFAADQRSGMEKLGSGIRDGKRSDSGSGLNIPDPQHCE
jgi:hypothetical protein